MKIWGGIFLSLMINGALPTHALTTQQPWQKGLVELRPEHKLYVEYRKAEPGKTTLFLLNGLTWSTRDWKRFVEALDQTQPGIGIVLYDMQGMGRTLLENPLVRYNIEIDAQAEDLKQLKKYLNVRGPVAVAGLSYGGAVAMLYASKYPRDFKKVIAMAPFIERLTEQDKIIERWIGSHRMIYPFDPRTGEELYDHYLRILIYTTYPLAEPVLLENPYKLEATFRMVQGAKEFNATRIANRLPWGVVHLMGAIEDEFVKEPRLALFWDSIKTTAASYLRMHNTKHKIPSENPEMAAAWVHEVLSENPAIARGRVFEADPLRAEARSGQIVIPLRKAGFCESLLRKTFGPR